MSAAMKLLLLMKVRELSSAAENRWNPPDKELGAKALKKNKNEVKM